MSAITLSKRLTAFMIAIALFKELTGYSFVTATEVTKVIRCFSETNTLRFIHSIRGSPTDVVIQEWDIVDIEIVPFTKIFMDKFKSKNGASTLALFN